MLEPLYSVQVDCKLCEMSYSTSKVRSSFKKSVKRDADFCNYYEQEDMNPDYYVVHVCPSCGFAATEHFNDKLSESQKQMLLERITSNWKNYDYGGQRNWEDALHCYKLALLCAQITAQKDRVIAGLLHHLAWLYRYKHDRDQEQRFLQYALDAYVKVFEIEGVSVNNARLMYLLGEINRRLGNYHEAIRWFGRVIEDKSIMDAAMIAASREQWAKTREDMKQAQAGTS